jgi:hypothetical protein
MEITYSPHISIRMATEADRSMLIQLAALDSAPAPLNGALVADIDGEIVAAQSLAGSRPIADPFQLTSNVTDLLALRASQLPPATHPRRRHLPRSVHRRRAVAA